MDVGKEFIKELKKSRKEVFKELKPSIHYDKEYDILLIHFKGKLKCEGTICATDDLRFDVAPDGTIIGIEIENFSYYQKKNSFIPRKKKK